MIQIITTVRMVVFIIFVANIQVSLSDSDESHLIDDKNINWMVPIFTRSSVYSPFTYKCQGVLLDSKLIYTVDQCVGALDPVENIRVRIYKASGENNDGATDFEEREIEHIGWQRFYLSPAAPSIQVRRITHLYLKTPFNLQLNVKFPTRNNNNYNIPNNIDINSCFYTSLQPNLNGFNVMQSKAKYIATKETCCNENGAHVCTTCSIGRKVFCAGSVGAAQESSTRNEMLASSLACKAKSENSIYIVGISINNTRCAPKFTTL